MIFTADDLRHMVIRNTLKYLGDWSPAAENLLLGTAAQESGLGFCMHEKRRIGIYHLTTTTHKSVWDKYLLHIPEMASEIRGLAGQRSFLKDPHGELVTNLKYATAIAWMVYRRVEQPLPAADDILGLATFWHRHYHPKPTGTVAEFVRNYRDLVLPSAAMAA